VPNLLPDVAPEMQQVFKATIEKMRQRGLPVKAMELPADFTDLLPAARLINDYEGARTHEQRWKQHGDHIGRKLAELVERGLRIPDEEYGAALETVRRARLQIKAIFEEIPVVLTPAATGPAPKGLESTGDPRMNSPWTALGVPAISVSMAVGSALPLGLQMTAAHGRDEPLLDAAVQVERFVS
jgi:Asp-tRNA(Asn)/Glu-tRNA(Gln) amidotransferase A subunit family amidase